MIKSIASARFDLLDGLKHLSTTDYELYNKPTDEMRKQIIDPNKKYGIDYTYRFSKIKLNQLLLTYEVENFAEQFIRMMDYFKPATGEPQCYDKIVSLYKQLKEAKSNHSHHTFFVDYIGYGLGLRHNALNYDIKSVISTISSAPISTMLILDIVRYANQKVCESGASWINFDEDYDNVYNQRSKLYDYIDRNFKDEMKRFNENLPYVMCSRLATQNDEDLLTYEFFISRYEISKKGDEFVRNLLRRFKLLKMSEGLPAKYFKLKKKYNKLMKLVAIKHYYKNEYKYYHSVFDNVEQLTYDMVKDYMIHIKESVKQIQ